MSGVDLPKLRIAYKAGEFHVLWPGELAAPFKRSGYQIIEEGQEIHGDEIDFGAALAAVLPKVRERLLGDSAKRAGALAHYGHLTEGEIPADEFEIETLCDATKAAFNAAFDAAFPEEEGS